MGRALPHFLLTWQCACPSKGPPAPHAPLPLDSSRWWQPRVAPHLHADGAAGAAKVLA